MKHFFYLIKQKLSNLLFRTLFKILKLDLQPNYQLKKDNHRFCTIQNDPHFYLLPESNSLKGWIRFKISLRFDFIGKPCFYYDCGNGFNELDKIMLPIGRDGHVDCLLRMPDGCQQVRFDPMDQAGCFELNNFKSYQVSRVIAWCSALIISPAQ